MNRKAITRFCNATISNHALSDHHSEVAWALWTMIELKLQLTPDSITSLETLSNSVCTLLAISVFKNSNQNGVQPFSNLSQFATSDSLYKEEWLLSYEGGKRRWLNNQTLSHINSDPHFAELIKNNVSFYDENIRLAPIFKLKRDSEQEFNVEFFNTDRNLARFFDFDSQDEEYFDNASPDIDWGEDDDAPPDIDWDRDDEPTPDQAIDDFDDFI